MAEFRATGRPNRAPTHPGAILREDILPAIGMSITEFADRLRISRQQLHRLLSEEAGISPEMALRLGKFCGNGPDVWLNMQQNLDLWEANKRLASEIATIETLVV